MWTNKIVLIKKVVCRGLVRTRIERWVHAHMHAQAHTHSASKHQNTCSFPVAPARWLRPHKEWNSCDRSKLLTVRPFDCLSSSHHRASERWVMRLERQMMYNRSRSTGFPLKSHYTHKWSACAQSTDRVSESAATAVRASSCQGGWVNTLGALHFE